jgi:hypothetical protein
MNFLSYLGGVPASAKEAVDVIAKGPAPTELELSLRQMHADHLNAMQAIKNLTEISVSQTTRTVDQVTMLRDLKRVITASEAKHFAAFELAQRPLLRAIEELDKRVTNQFAKDLEQVLHKLNNMDADIHELKRDRHDELDAHTYVLNTQLKAVSERLDGLAKLVAKSLIKHPEGATVAPPPKPQGGRRKGAGRKPGSKPRPLEAQYADISDRLQRSRPNSKARLMYQFRLTELRQKLGMAPIRKEGK